MTFRRTSPPAPILKPPAAGAPATGPGPRPGAVAGIPKLDAGAGAAPKEEANGLDVELAAGRAALTGGAALLNEDANGFELLIAGAAVLAAAPLLPPNVKPPAPPPPKEKDGTAVAAVAAGILVAAKGLKPPAPVAPLAPAAKTAAPAVVGGKSIVPDVFEFSPAEA